MTGKEQEPRVAWNPPFVTGYPLEERILLSHGAGGRKMHRLIREMFLARFGNRLLARLEDGAVFPMPRAQLCLTTDSYVVQPLFFPGGDIGKLAVSGTVNDLAVMGATPKFLSLSLVIREGMERRRLDLLCRSIARTARHAGVTIVTGDTKVIEHGPDELYINTTGLGLVRPGVKLGPELVRPDDVVLINGPIGEHEAAIAVARGQFRFRTRLRSDCTPLNRLIETALKAGGIRLMRDPTRGGLATTLNEFALATGLGIVIDEERLPISRPVQGVAELLGLDPLYMANEGKVVMIAAPQAEKRLLALLRRNPNGRQARRIGTVVRTPKGVWLRTRLGSLRPLIMLEGEQLPRIC